MVFKSEVFKIEQIYLSVRDRKGPELTEGREKLTQMMTDEKNEFLPIYSTWLGRPVVLLIQIRQGRVPIPCSIIGESDADLRVLLRAGWEMDVRKELILAIEEDSVPVNTRPN
jgi:hypothetical protein